LYYVLVNCVDEDNFMDVDELEKSVAYVNALSTNDI
jgi:hypothetical protein